MDTLILPVELDEWVERQAWGEFFWDCECIRDVYSALGRMRSNGEFKARDGYEYSFSSVARAVWYAIENDVE